VVLKDDMIQQIRQTPTLSKPGRELTPAFAKDYREIPDRLDNASWLVVRGSWARPAPIPASSPALYSHQPGLLTRNTG
jgi:hypothetical protein